MPSASAIAEAEYDETYDRYAAALGTYQNLSNSKSAREFALAQCRRLAAELGIAGPGEHNRAEPKPAYERYERDGKIAVLISPGFGAGWSTWFDGDKQQAATDRRLVEAVLTTETISEELIAEVFGPDQYVYTGGLRDIEVQWVEKGRRFYIHEYDGSETIKTDDDLIWTA